MSATKLGDRPASEMTVREAMAMELAKSASAVGNGIFRPPQSVAEYAIYTADALLHELERVR